MDFKNLKILVRGAGDIASGVIWSLAYAGFKVACVDIEKPTCIRTEVSFSSAIFDKEKTLNNIKCVYVKDANDIQSVWQEGNVPLLIDPDLDLLNVMSFDVLVDAILAKKNTGTKKDMAKLVIGIGPGFTAKVDCDFVIETMRGHNLSTIYEEGSAIANTGVPGLIAAHGMDRVMHSPCEGIIHNIHKIGDAVKKDDILAEIEECENGKSTGKKVPLKASIDGLLRGIMRDGLYLKEGVKTADIDPRLSEYDNCFTISDKARAIGSAVVTAIMHAYN